MTSKASDRSNSDMHWSTRALGTVPPKNTTSGIRVPPQYRQRGGCRCPISDSGTPASPSGAGVPEAPSSSGFSSCNSDCTASRSLASPHSRQRTLSRRPCRSVTRRLPARWCSRSTFWVTRPSDPAARLQDRQGAVAPVGPRVPHPLPAHVGPGPVAAAGANVGDKGLVGDGITALPATGPVAVGGNTRGSADARSRQDKQAWVARYEFPQVIEIVIQWIHSAIVRHGGPGGSPGLGHGSVRQPAQPGGDRHGAGLRRLPAARDTQG